MMGIFCFSDWKYGPTFCWVNNFIAMSTVASSVLTLVVMFYEK